MHGEKQHACVYVLLYFVSINAHLGSRHTWVLRASKFACSGCAYTERRERLEPTSRACGVHVSSLCFCPPLVCSFQTAPPQRYNRSVGSALWNAVTSARNQLSGVKITGTGGGKSSGGLANREKDAAADDRKLRAVHGETGGRERSVGERGGGSKSCMLNSNFVVVLRAGETKFLYLGQRSAQGSGGGVNPERRVWSRPSQVHSKPPGCVLRTF